MSRIFIVTGASGKLGEAFITALKDRSEIVCGFSRRPITSPADKMLVADLLDEKQVETTLAEVGVEHYTEVVLIHTVGKFKFHENDHEIIDGNSDGIDDEVFDTNVLTTKNLLKFILPLVKQGVVVRMCAFASVSDKHAIPYWSSYTRSKNILRGYLQTLCEMQELSALMVNVTTVDTGNENFLRPNADKTYWLRPEEVVNEVLPEIESLIGYKEIDIIKKNPSFNDAYYIDHEKLLEKWKREMGDNTHLPPS